MRWLVLSLIMLAFPAEAGPYQASQTLQVSFNLQSYITLSYHALPSGDRYFVNVEATSPGQYKEKMYWLKPGSRIVATGEPLTISAVDPEPDSPWKFAERLALR